MTRDEWLHHLASSVHARDKAVMVLDESVSPGHGDHRHGRHYNEAVRTAVLNQAGQYRAAAAAAARCRDEGPCNKVG